MIVEGDGSDRAVIKVDENVLFDLGYHAHMLEAWHSPLKICIILLYRLHF